MNKKHRILLLAASAILAAAALAQTVTEQLVRIQTDPASGRATAYFEKTVTLEGAAYKQPWTEVSWEIASESPVTITLADGTTAQTTRAHVLAAVLAIANEEKAATAP